MPAHVPVVARAAPRDRSRILFLVTEDWYFWSHRLPIARAARDAGFEIVVATRVNRHGEAIEAEGFALVPIRLRRKETRPWAELASLVELVSLYRRLRPAIVHHVALKPVLYGSVAARLTAVPVTINALAGLGFVFTSRGLIARSMRPFIKVLLGWLLKSPRVHTIVQNPDDEAVLRRLGVSDAHLTLIKGSGVDIERFAPGSEPDSPVVVSMVSRMLWDKGVADLVAAARLLRARGKLPRIRLIGTPDPDNPASIPRAALEGWEAEGLIVWEGRREDIPSLWAESHIAVLPSHREGLPMSLLEAAASGRPLITTDVPGCREVVEDGVTGFLVPISDPEALASRIETLAEDPALRASMGRAGRRRVEAEFAQEKVVAATLALYRSLEPVS